MGTILECYIRSHNLNFLRAMREDTENILNLKSAFTIDELRKAYKTQALKLHPDKCIDESKETEITHVDFVKLKNIYDANLALFHLLSVTGSAFPYDAMTCLSICLEKNNKPLFYILLGMTTLRKSRWVWQIVGIMLLMIMKCSTFLYR